jgi:hypothetical protein
MLNRRQWILDHVLYVQRCPYLVKHRAHVAHARVGEHDELELCGRLKVMHLVLARAIRQERIVVPAQLADNAAQREDGSEDELGVVFDCEGFACYGWHVAIAERVGGGITLDGRFGPALGVYALGWAASALSCTWDRYAKLTVAVEYVKGVDGHVGLCRAGRDGLDRQQQLALTCTQLSAAPTVWAVLPQGKVD